MDIMNIKCNNYNNKNLQKGDFIYICLQDNEITELNMPNEDDIKFKISLMFYNNTKLSYVVGIKGENKQFQYNLTNSDNKIFQKWNKELFGNKIIINNYNQIPILLYLKINADESSIKIIENSQKDLKIEKNIIYALLLPKNSNKGKIYGVYQNIFSSNQVNNFCLYNDFNDNNEIFSFLPNSSCNNIFNHSIDLNVTNYGIYLNDENKYFYTYIYYNGEKDVYLNYKHIIISNSLLEHKKINYFEESYNIIYYIINENKELEGNSLFLQIIKENKTDLSKIYIQSKGNNILNTDLYYYNDINLFNSHSNDGSVFQLQNNLNLVFKFYETKKSLFYYEFGNSLSFNYNDDISVKAELIKDSKNKYILKFKPFEKEGMADYEVFIFNWTSEYTFDELSNIYNIYNLEFDEKVKKITFQNIKSSNNDFADDIKSKFILDFGDDENYNYNILLVGIKTNPNTKKFYSQIQISSLKIKFSNIKNTFCFSPNFNEENKSIINLVKDIYPNEDGNLILQWRGNSIKNNQKIIIYRGLEEDKNIIYSSEYNDYSYFLNTNIVDNNFDIIFSVNDNNSDNEICLQYITSLGKEEYDNSEIEYKYFTSIIFPYFIKSKTSLEIFKLKYNKNIIKDISIKVDYYKNNEIILKEKYYQNNIKIIANDYYFGIYNSFKNTNISLKIYLKITNNLDIKSELESFIIEWIKPNTLSPNNSYNISFTNNPTFYYIDLNEYIGKNKALLLFTNLYDKKEFNYSKGNYFKNDSKLIFFY